jgi:glycosyltransferase involved in cell wall biosynthesis
MILVSIIVPCYNQAKFLAETLESILVQTHSNWECIIVNDGSVDNTEEIAKRYISKDIRFKYFYQDNQGISVARNAGISVSSGKYILPLDGDDLISRSYIEEAIPILETHSEVKIVYCNAEFFGEKQGSWNLPAFCGIENFLLDNSIFCSGIFRRIDYEKTHGYNPNMCYGIEDWDFWISLLKDGGTVYKIPVVHFFYRINKGSRNYNLEKSQDKLAKMKNQMVENHLSIYLEKIGNPIDLRERILELENAKDFTFASLLLKCYKKIKQILIDLAF